MTLTEMLAHCEAQMALDGEAAKISLVMPGTFGRGTKQLGPGGPTGNVVSEQVGGTVLVLFSARQVKTYLRAVPTASQF